MGMAWFTSVTETGCLNCRPNFDIASLYVPAGTSIISSCSPTTRSINSHSVAQRVRKFCCARRLNLFDESTHRNQAALKPGRSIGDEKTRNKNCKSPKCSSSNSWEMGMKTNLIAEWEKKNGDVVWITLEYFKGRLRLEISANIIGTGPIFVPPNGVLISLPNDYAILKK